MKRYPVEYRPRASEDLLDIAAYILDQSRNINTTESYLDRIQARCTRIGDAPLGGVAREDLGPGIRMTVFEKSVVILYTIEAETVWITNVFSGGRDYETLLKA
ncbi:type II toxin-antitoxin system RelE/ParE family toxin [Rhizobium sp. BK376]|uniref:type II toxin-antitoxin system RelE/ParE family toxin n=1 Tax=Rhizobium sp. BK376 TaxID=2512149 RepID=UPI001050D72B|nr:type II toxin-antitoxin system RelE/ParE family toxin [Rhizobium sp. BK376]TCR93257.1 toxin ParE1/3/4 [Rhizobium sp. BK376]